MEKNRTKQAAKNFLAAVCGTAVNSILMFVSRTIFIYTLGSKYLGINGLYTNILSILSLAELGIGNAISFSLYKPLAENDQGKIKSLMRFYKISYRIIAAAVLIIGICLAPFLKYIIKGAEDVDHLVLYYFIYLFNTVTSYLLTYKQTIIIADQKQYLITNITNIVKVITAIGQGILLLVYANFIGYLILGAIIQLGGNVFINFYCNKKYPFLLDNDVDELCKDEKVSIFTKIKALLAHKIGDKAISQTDNIIISAFINVTTVGLVSNFTMIINMVNSFVVSFFEATVAGWGNLIATESSEKKYSATKRFIFLGYIFYGWTAICLYSLLIPFVTIWIGKDKLLAEIIVLFICLDYYMVGMRFTLSVIKQAAGAYEQDKWVPLTQAAINLVVSVIGAKTIGLTGIYVGTIVSGLVPSIARPIVVYRYVLNRSSKEYFFTYIIRIAEVAAICALIKTVLFLTRQSSEILTLIEGIFLCMVIPPIFVFVRYRKSDEFLYAKELIVKKVLRR